MLKVHLRLSMAKMVRLWTMLASLSRGLAVLMTPLRASTLKKRSKSVFRSIEYLEKRKSTSIHTADIRKKNTLFDRGIDLTFRCFFKDYDIFLPSICAAIYKNHFYKTSMCCVHNKNNIGYFQTLLMSLDCKFRKAAEMV